MNGAWLLVLLVAVAGCTQGPVPAATGAESPSTTPPATPSLPNHTTAISSELHFAVQPLADLEYASDPSLARVSNGLVLTGGGCPTTVECDSSLSRNATYVFESTTGTNWTLRNDASDYLATAPDEADSMGASAASDGRGGAFVLDVVQSRNSNGVASTEAGPRHARIYHSPGLGQPWKFERDLQPTNSSWVFTWLAVNPSLQVVVWSGPGVEVSTSRDGSTWTTQAPPFAIERAGPPVFHDNTVYVPAYLRTEEGAPPGTLARQPVLLSSPDAGATWSIDGPAATTYVSAYEQARLDVTDDIPVVAFTAPGAVLAWAQVDQVQGVATGSSIWIAQKVGSSWMPPAQVSSTPNAVKPWIVGGAGNRFAVAYYASTWTGDPDRAYAASWDAAVTVIDGKQSQTNTIWPNAHARSICSQPPCLGSNTVTPGHYIGAETLPDGLLVVVASVDADNQFAALGDAGASTEGYFVVAVQDGGAPLGQS